VPLSFALLVYVMFFCSGAAALIYQVVWVRSLSLVFGGSHLAVTTVLAVFMAGLALGSRLFGRRAEDRSALLRLYGMLEIGIALSAVVVAFLVMAYPKIYVPLATLADNSPLYLSLIRVLFCCIALIVPTTLMGGTLPILSAFIAQHKGTQRDALPFLYAFNTFGAVAGASVAGFYFLPTLSVSTTLVIAIAINLAVGSLAIFLQGRLPLSMAASANADGEPEIEPAQERVADDPLPFRLVLWGIGVSGFCALGYEILWTRILSIVIGASVYGFTIMLSAFLVGIALGSSCYGILENRPGKRDAGLRTVAGFGVVQIVIGLAALAVTFFIRHLPSVALLFQNQSIFSGMDSFAARQFFSLLLAFSYMVVPAFFMGVAFPLAGKIHLRYRRLVGHAVGEVLTWNTVGAIIGSALSGFLLVYLFGIERSLQMLTLVNIGFGLVLLASLLRKRAFIWLAAAVPLGCIVFLAVNDTALRIWNRDYFAIYRANQPEAFATPEQVQEALQNTEVLYYGEGVSSIVSSIRIRGGGTQSFITNGRGEASNNAVDMQCQYTLGHLPMLLHKNPEKVFVLGTGSGMTLGAVSVHPTVQRIVLAEIEPKVLGVARTFAEYNHSVLDNPKLQIVFNDGRNYLLTSDEKFDVITADPIHPWFSGAGYLYTDEYFRLAAQHLSPGGIICQWLPLYELSRQDLMTVVRTLREHFRYTMIWMTHYDAELIGSNEPIVIDEEELARRIAVPEVSRDLKMVNMGSATDLLSYFVAGPVGSAAYARGGLLNTDDNLFLEFSAPRSIGKSRLMAENVATLLRFRESIQPYLHKPADKAARDEQLRRWYKLDRAGMEAGVLHAGFLAGEYDTPSFREAAQAFDRQYPDYAPWRFLEKEYSKEIAMSPSLLASIPLQVMNERGLPVRMEVSAVKASVSPGIAAVMIVDNSARVIFGQLTVQGAGRDGFMKRFASDTLAEVQKAYLQERNDARGERRQLPGMDSMTERVRLIVARQVNVYRAEATGATPAN